MSSIHPSAALVKQKYALISGLRAQGMAIAEQGAAAQAGDLFLVTDGDVVEHPARTIVVSDGPVPAIIPAMGGQPASVTYSAAESGVGNSFVRALLAGLAKPTAAAPERLGLFNLAAPGAHAGTHPLANHPTRDG